MDWMTLAIETVGAGIFCVWVIIPIREYRSIYERLRQKRHSPGVPVIQRDVPQKENRA
jgi:hypothetical protein